VDDRVFVSRFLCEAVQPASFPQKHRLAPLLLLLSPVLPALYPLWYAVPFQVIVPAPDSHCSVLALGGSGFTANGSKVLIRLRWRSLPTKICGWFLLLGLALTLATAVNRIDLPVKVNGQIMRFGLDTGSGVGVVLWRDVAALMALPSSPQPQVEPLPAGRVPFDLSDPVNLEFFGNGTEIGVRPCGPWEVGIAKRRPKEMFTQGCRGAG